MTATKSKKSKDALLKWLCTLCAGSHKLFKFYAMFSSFNRPCCWHVLTFSIDGCIMSHKETKAEPKLNC